MEYEAHAQHPTTPPAGQGFGKGMMLKLSTHSSPHQDKRWIWEGDETKDPTPTLSFPGQDGALRVG